LRDDFVHRCKVESIIGFLYLYKKNYWFPFSFSFFPFFKKKKIIYCLFITLLREESGGPYDVDT
jgi:hypothetical protein